MKMTIKEVLDQLPKDIGEAVTQYPDDPVYVIPPDELEPLVTIRADLLAEQRDWGHANLGLKAVHEAGYLGEGCLVAICDTGIDVSHQDLSDRINEVGNQDFTSSQNGYLDAQGHGTHCAGIAFAGLNDVGMIGAAPKAKGIAVKVLNNNGSGASTWIAAGIRHAADQGADVISLSLGGPYPDQKTRAAIQYATQEKGCWVVCAAGNDGKETTSYPGHYPESIGVAATGSDDKRASFSTINGENDVAAPGVEVWSSLPKGRYGKMSGTSMATPYVAGCLALVRSAIKRAGKPVPKQAELLAAIAQTSKDIAPQGRDAGTGWGLVNVKGLIDLLAGPPVTPPPTPIPTPNVVQLKPGESVLVKA